jgi:hypothetical protein
MSRGIFQIMRRTELQNQFLDQFGWSLPPSDDTKQLVFSHGDLRMRNAWPNVIYPRDRDGQTPSNPSKCTAVPKIWYGELTYFNAHVVVVILSACVVGFGVLGPARSSFALLVWFPCSLCRWKGGRVFSHDQSWWDWPERSGQAWVIVDPVHHCHPAFGAS